MVGRGRPHADVDDRFGERLRIARAARHLEQREAAKAAGLSASHLSKLESGDANPGQAMLRRLAGAYGVDVAWLARGEGEMESPVNAIADGAEQQAARAVAEFRVALPHDAARVAFDNTIAMLRVAHEMRLQAVRREIGGFREYSTKKPH